MTADSSGNNIVAWWPQHILCVVILKRLALFCSGLRGGKMPATSSISSRGLGPSNVISQRPDSAQAAFDKALQLVRSDHPDSIPEAWLDGIHTIVDVEEELQRVRRKYEAKPKSAIRRLLGNFSLTMMHYTKILDMLVQHHPEYVSLAWGTTKLLFVVSFAQFLIYQVLLLISYKALPEPRRVAL
jgi:hypothetical protein